MLSMRGGRQREASDEQILGSGDFVERVMQEADENFRKMTLARRKRREVEDISCPTIVK